ncbi:MAG TPA: ATP-binding protein [Oligoflexus sp.]|uniref:sensor histidine kinase n=1 Tax=Oligoflexus sp. TaxID=1971216 RepID=UPI002D7EE167|nr:ATP-binding protein [Oligoflexus sp.]HET9239402.1 ATP-binding protein [Oligoflexus sp.]
MPFRTTSLATRASLAVFTISLFVVIALSAFQLIYDYNEELDQVNSQIEALEASVLSIVSRSLWTYDQDQLRSILLGLKTLPYVSYAAIGSDDGLIMSQGERPQVAIFKKIDITSPAAPYEVIGELIIEAEKQQIIDNLWRRAKSILLTNFLLIMLISGIIILIFQFRVTKPLIELSEYASKIQMNSLSNTIDPRRLQDEHEVGRVYRAIDTMQRNIQKDFQTILEAEAELEKYKSNLEKLVQERTEKLIQTTKNLVESSRKAGMAEVAIGVLHNIGNALTGANVKVQNLHHSFQNETPIGHLQDLIKLLKEQEPKLGEFLTQDDRGKKVLPFLEVISQELNDQHEDHKQMITLLRKDLSTVSQLIAKQQSHAKFTGTVENLLFADCVEDVLALQSYEMDKYHVKVQKTYQASVTLSSDRHKVLQILTNLISNAIQAMHQNQGPRLLTIKVFREGDQVGASVTDNGTGITDDQMTHMFRYGYTTKKSGHGFGLHSCSIDAKILGGTLSCTSEGRGKGSTFTLMLPIETKSRGAPSDEDLLTQIDNPPTELQSS